MLCSFISLCPSDLSETLWNINNIKLAHDSNSNLHCWRARISHRTPFKRGHIRTTGGCHPGRVFLFNTGSSQVRTVSPSLCTIWGQINLGHGGKGLSRTNVNHGNRGSLFDALKAQGISNFNVQANCLRILLRCRLWFSVSREEHETLHFCQSPKAVYWDPWATVQLARTGDAMMWTEMNL